MLTPLSEERLGRAVGPPWSPPMVVAETGSTNADLVAAARSGTARTGDVLVAELQVQGRGRLGRGWQAPSGTALTFSVLVEPGVPPARWGWLSLLAGVALVEAVRTVAEADVGLKWPNDLLAPDGRKLAGILAERVDAERAVVGMGLNVAQDADALPVETATSLWLLTGREVDRGDVLVATLDRLAALLDGWRADPAAARSHYLAHSRTVGQAVRVELPAGQALRGTAIDVDADGRLVVAPADGSPPQSVAAGDVVHVRAAD